MARAKLSTEDFRNKLSQEIKQFATEPVDPDLWEWFVRRLYYLSGNFDDKNIYPQLKDLLDKVDKDHNTHGNHFYYLATAANYFAPIVEQLAATGQMEENQRWRRVIVEKPFGHDLESAKALNAQLLRVAHESQIYRIDHYLGKETVQNILALRFANGIFEPIWNRRYIDHIQISVAETVGGHESARQLLRSSGSAARHGSESHHAIDQPHCDGTAGFVPCRRSMGLLRDSNT